MRCFCRRKVSVRSSACEGRGVGFADPGAVNAFFRSCHCPTIGGQELVSLMASRTCNFGVFGVCEFAVLIFFTSFAPSGSGSWTSAGVRNHNTPLRLQGYRRRSPSILCSIRIVVSRKHQSHTFLVTLQTFPSLTSAWSVRCRALAPKATGITAVGGKQPSGLRAAGLEKAPNHFQRFKDSVLAYCVLIVVYFNTLSLLCSCICLLWFYCISSILHCVFHVYDHFAWLSGVFMSLAPLHPVAVTR